MHLYGVRSTLSEVKSRLKFPKEQKSSMYFNKGAWIEIVLVGLAWLLIVIVLPLLLLYWWSGILENNLLTHMTYDVSVPSVHLFLLLALHFLGGPVQKCVRNNCYCPCIATMKKL